MTLKWVTCPCPGQGVVKRKEAPVGRQYRSMHVLKNRDGKQSQTAVGLVGNVVSAEAEGSGQCDRLCGEWIRGVVRWVQAHHRRVLRMGVASCVAAFLDVSLMLVRTLSEQCCCPCSDPHSSLSLPRRLYLGTNGTCDVSPLPAERTTYPTSRTDCLCGNGRNVGGTGARIQSDGTWTAWHGGHEADL